MEAKDVKYGRVHKHKCFGGENTLYAVSGNIAMHPYDNEEDCRLLTVDQAKKRAKAIEDMLKDPKLLGDFSAFGIDQRQQLRHLLGILDDVIKEAIEQGDPMDPSVQKWYKTHKPWKGSRSHISSGTDEHGIVLPDAPYETGRPPVSFEVLPGKHVYPKEHTIRPESRIIIP